MKIRIYFLLLLMQTIFINNSLAEEKVERKIEPFENTTHLSLGISNLMFKGGISRDLNEYFEIGLNAYSGYLSYYEFNQKPFVLYEPRNVTSGYSLEFEVKTYPYKEEHVEDYNNLHYLKAFIGSSLVDRWKYDPTIDGEISNCYFGVGFGNKLYMKNGVYNLGFDLGLNIDSSYNSIAFVFFPRVLLEGDINF